MNTPSASATDASCTNCCIEPLAAAILAGGGHSESWGFDLPPPCYKITSCAHSTGVSEMLRRPCLALMLLGFISFNASAHDHAHHSHNAAAHQHGLGHLDLVLEGQQLILELRIPAEDLLGFEHAPQTPGQQAQLEALQAT